LYADFGFRLFDVEDLEYGKSWALKNKDFLKAHHRVDWDRVPAPRVLDGVLFLNRRGIANHAGVILSGWRFIHASRAGVIVSRLTEDVWHKRIEGFYRLKEKEW